MKKILLIIFIASSLNLVIGQSAIYPIQASKLLGIHKITSDQDDNLYLHGLFSGTLTLGGNTFNSEQGENFLCKLDSSYKVLWAVQSRLVITDMKVKNGKLFILGQYYSPLSFLGVEKTPKSYNFFFACLSLTGDLEWYADGQSNGPIYSGKFDLDNEGNAYILCTIKEAVTLEDKKINIKDYRNAFLAKYNRQGKPQWVRLLTGGYSFITGLYATAICYDAKSNQILVGGDFSAKCTFDSISIESRMIIFEDGEQMEGNEGFLARYSVAGVCTSVKSIATEVKIEKILTDTKGNIYMGGYFRGNTDDGISVFGKGHEVKTTMSKYTTPTEDGYIAKFDAQDNFQWIALCQGSNANRIIDFVIDGSGSLYACGFSHVDAGFSGPTKKVTIAPVKGEGDIFAVKINSSGDPEWFKRGGGTGNDNANSLCLTTKEVKIAGLMSGLATYDDISVNLSGKYYNGVILSSKK